MAEITITLSAAHTARVAAALEESLDLVDEEGQPRAATVGDYKDYVIGKTKQFVLSSEKRVAAKAATDPIDEVDPT